MTKNKNNNINNNLIKNKIIKNIERKFVICCNVSTWGWKPWSLESRDHLKAVITWKPAKKILNKKTITRKLWLSSDQFIEQ